MDIFMTGVSSGLGWRLAKTLLLDGHQIFGVSRRPETDPIIQELQRCGKLTYDSVDLSDTKNIVSMIASLRESSVRFDRVILNAAVIHDDLSESFQLDCDKILDSLRTNFLSAVTLVQCLLPLVRSEGNVMAISSLSALCDLDPNRIGYPLSKVGLNSLFASFQLKFPTHPKFLVVNLGRMETSSRGFFTISYDQAVAKIKKVLSYSAPSRAYYFPIHVALLSLALAKLPLIIQRGFVAKRRNAKLANKEPLLLRKSETL